MINERRRPFVWDEEEASMQIYATNNIVEHGDEFNINVMYIGGESFVSHCDDNNLKPEQFTVGQFNAWKDAVTDRMKELQIQIETEEFKKLEPIK